MADRIAHEARSRNMARIRSRDTGPEVRVRSILHRCGFRFRLHQGDLPGNPDIVLPRHHKVIFVHGCFWHSHGCKRGGVPQSNLGYWLPKLKRTVKRDRSNLKALESLGWKVLTVWECETMEMESLLAKMERFLCQQ